MGRLARGCWLLLSLLVVAAPGAAQEGAEAKRLLAAASPRELRASLRRHALATEATARTDAGADWYWIGRSWERAGAPDSALAAYRHAVRLRGDHVERLALVDVLLRRRAAGDVAAASEALAAGHTKLEAGMDQLAIGYDVREAWAEHLAGHSSKAVALFEPHEQWILRRPEWRYRVAVAEIAAGDVRRAYSWLFPLAVHSRAEDEDVMARMQEISAQFNAGSRVENEVRRDMAKADMVEHEALEQMNARRIHFAGRDGFPLSAVVVPPDSEVAKAWGAIVLTSPSDSVADYDSLAVALTRARCATALLDRRGSGGSVSPKCPLPDRWAGREEELERACASDVSRALDVLATKGPLDTTRYVVVGVGETAPIVVQTAERDPRVAAIVLVSSRTDVVERGPMRARIAALQLPVYFQDGPDDLFENDFVEELYQSGNRGVSRVAEAHAMGHGVRQFYFDPAVAGRLTRWLDETLRNAKPRALRPAARRRG